MDENTEQETPELDQEGDILRNASDDHAFMYVPINRIDKDRWEVEGQATSDDIDHYETIFDYDSSKRAFNTWRGNIREMHNPNKAVGHALEITPHDETRTIDVKAFVSKGAPDTWQKVLDGTLTGFSIGVPQGKFKTKMVERNGKNVKMYYDHQLAELSLVDNPGSPGCTIAVVRADGVATDVLDDSTEAAEEPPITADDIERKSVPISKMNRDRLHGIRNGAMQMCNDNGCEECGEMMASQAGDSGRSIESQITRHMTPLVQRMNAVLSTFAQQPTSNPQVIQELSTEPLERRIADVERAFDTKLTEVRSVLTEVKELAVKIAAMPMPGGPAVMAMDKRLSTSPQHNQYNQVDDIAALQRAAQLFPTSNDTQIALAAEVIKRQNGNRG